MLYIKIWRDVGHLMWRDISKKRFQNQWERYLDRFKSCRYLWLFWKELSTNLFFYIQIWFFERGKLDSRFMEKVHFTSLNYPWSLVFLRKLENQVNQLPQLLKPPIISVFQRWFCLFIFLFILMEYLKNYNKSQKIIKKSSFVGLHMSRYT